MINLTPQITRQFRPKQQSTQGFGVPAAVEGILANAPVYGGQGNLSEAIWLYNMIPGQYGLRVRKGSRDHATNILDASGAAGDVRSILDYKAPDGTTKKFACTSEGIYDITVSGTGTWTKVYDFTTENADTGYCNYVQYTNTGGTHYLLVVDESNGYITFDGTSWAVPTITGGVTAADFVDITEYRGRICLVERDSGNVWYLGLLSISGAATQFEMGARMKHGGHVKQLTTWTFDDGAWLDDRLLVLGEGGDLIVWQGDLDLSPTMQGRWYVGLVPKGRRAMSEWGGDVAIITSEGVRLASTLVQGGNTVNNANTVTRRIDRYFRDQMASNRTSYGWSAVLHPDDGIAIFTVPQPVSSDPIQFVLDTTVDRWCMFRGLDMLCAADGPDGLYFGTSDGKVVKYTGTADGADTTGANATPIEFSLLTHYSDLGMAGRWKRMQFIRPLWLGDATPAYGIAARYDYDLSEASGLGTFVPGSIGAWDSGIWDASTWGGLAQSFLVLGGLQGMGRHVAIAVRGESSQALNLVGFDLMLDGGGML